MATIKIRRWDYKYGDEKWSEYIIRCGSYPVDGYDCSKYTARTAIEEYINRYSIKEVEVWSENTEKYIADWNELTEAEEKVHDMEGIIFTMAKKAELELVNACNRYDTSTEYIGIDEIIIAEKRGAWCMFDELLQKLDLKERYKETYG